jgi:HlyD family secretion protein
MATRGPVTRTVRERGTLEAVETGYVVCEVGLGTKGRPVFPTIHWVIEDGTQVRKGDKLVVLDESPAREELQARKLAVAKASAARDQAAQVLRLVRAENKVEVRLAEIAVRLAELNLRKGADGAGDQKETLELQAEQARLLLDRARARAGSREAQALADLQTRTAQLERDRKSQAEADAQIAKCVLRAPRDGTAMYYVIPEGDSPLIAQGEPVREGQKLIVVADPTRLVARVHIHEALISLIRPGQEAVVRVDAYPGRLLLGRVAEVDNQPRMQDWLRDDVKMYGVRVTLGGAVPALKAGMSAAVSILVEQRANVLRVPTQALLAAGKKTVCLVKTDRDIQEREVVTGLAGDFVAEIRQGLEDGALVVRDPRALLANPALRGRGVGLVPGSPRGGRPPPRRTN